MVMNFGVWGLNTSIYVMQSGEQRANLLLRFCSPVGKFVSLMREIDVNCTVAGRLGEKQSSAVRVVPNLTVSESRTQLLSWASPVDLGMSE